jgi:formyltetrahydrofolate deformylase
MTTLESASFPLTAPSNSLASDAPAARKFVLTMSCLERAGIVHAVTTFLYERGFNIDEHQQFDDSLRQRLHLRTAFSGPAEYSPERLAEEFEPIRERSHRAQAA